MESSILTISIWSSRSTMYHSATCSVFWEVGGGNRELTFNILLLNFFFFLGGRLTFKDQINHVPLPWGSANERNQKVRRSEAERRDGQDYSHPQPLPTPAKLWVNSGYTPLLKTTALVR